MVQTSDVLELGYSGGNLRKHNDPTQQFRVMGGVVGQKLWSLISEISLRLA